MYTNAHQKIQKKMYRREKSIPLGRIKESSMGVGMLLNKLNFRGYFKLECFHFFNNGNVFWL